MNAADHYGLDELRRSCMTYLQDCLNVDTVCLLLRSAERYIQYKSTKSVVQKVSRSARVSNGTIVSPTSQGTTPPPLKNYIPLRFEETDIRHNHTLIVSSVESQIGVSPVQRCAIENQKVDIVVCVYCHSALLVLNGTLLNMIFNAPLALNRRFLSGHNSIESCFELC